MVAWFQQHHDAARLNAWTSTLGGFAFAAIAGIVAGHLTKPSRYVFLIGAAAFVIESSLQAWLWGGLALHPETLDPATARLAWTSPSSGVPF